MKYDDFIKKYNSSTDKNKFLKKHVTKTYLPYQQKISEAKEIIKRTCYEELNGKKVFKQDSPAFFMLFMLRVIANYTDVEFEEGADALAAFNALSESGLLEPIVLAIPQKEYDTFNTVLQMCKDDEMENYRSLAGFFDTKVDALIMTMNALAEATEKVESDVHSIQP